MKIKNVTRVIARETDLEITGATLLTVEEARELPEWLRKKLYWWWLRSPGKDSGHVAYVNPNGDIDNYGADVGNYYGGIRPALIISNFESSGLKIGDMFEFGDKQFEIISDKLAFCLGCITSMAFREDWKAPDANDYEKSDVKKVIDIWFERSIKV